MMGSTEEDDEQPPHRVCLGEPYWIDRTEVTNAQFAAFEGQAALASHWPDDNRPREHISWNEAHDFCESRGGRLPTEAEWEYAARGPDGWVYPWGNELDEDKVVDWNNSVGITAVVGSRPDGASWVGALDMSGNVWEWVADWYDADYYATLPEEAHYPLGPTTGHDRVLRGGSFNYPPVDARASNRAWNPPDDTTWDIGFRCIRPANASTEAVILPGSSANSTPAGEAPALTQMLTSTAGVTVRYPEDWVGQENELGDLELANSSAMLAAFDEPDAPIQSGQLAVVVRNPQPVEALDTGDRPSRADLMATLFVASDSGDVAVGDAIAIMLDETPAVRLDFSDDNTNAEGIFIGFVGQDHMLIVVVAVAPRGEFASAEALLLDIAASVSYTAPPSRILFLFLTHLQRD